MADRTGATASFYRHAWIGLGFVVLLFGGLGAWAVTTDIAGAVVAGGTVTVEGGSKRVQHQEGGIVGEFLVENGDVVEAGQLLVKLHGTATAANLAVIVSQLSEALALQARLQAESTGVEVVRPVSEIIEQSDSFDALLDAQERILERRASAQAGVASRLDEQIAQIEVQIEGLEAQQDAIDQQLELLSREESDIDALFADGLVETGRVNSIKRELARLRGERGRLTSETASARAAILEKRLQVVQLRDEFQTEVLQELQAVGQTIAELMQQKIAAEDMLARLEIRSPQDGVIHESVVQTVGGVVGPGETLMLVVPQSSRLVVHAHISPLDVDKLFLGQSVVLRMSGLDARTTPELDASIVGVSADLTQDPLTGESYYLAKISIPDSELRKLPDGQRLVPGMPAETFIQTGERTVLSYLVQPLAEQLNRAFRED